MRQNISVFADEDHDECTSNVITRLEPHALDGLLITSESVIVNFYRRFEQ
ncbi:MAG: hypothetical protein H7199_02140 [Burkholderiales bacterium]|nr:hypothetical protein [Flavobacterium sp.]